MFRSFWHRFPSVSCAVHRRSFIAINEPIQTYAVKSPEREKLESALQEMKSKAPLTVPICIGSDELTSQEVFTHPFPFDNKQTFVKCHMADEKQVKKAVETCLKARESWFRQPFKQRADVFLKAADLIAGKYRYELLAATMLGQGKTIFQAEIDAAAELADFLRFNVQFAEAALDYKPLSTEDCYNQVIYRPTEGFWAALPPFNFTAIAGNLASAPALMGNAVIWKPSPSAVYSNYVVFKILLEAGLPPGVINFVPADGPKFGSVITREPTLAGINYTGSTQVFKILLKAIAQNMDLYNTYPRTVGECGGKNYHFVHPSANTTDVALATLRSAFEYSGQKCSACSRLYVPASLWGSIRDMLVELMSKVKVGSPLEKETFTSAVIDANAFKKVSGYIDYAKGCPDLQLIAGGGCDDSVGYYIQPTFYKTNDPHNKLMLDDIFGPVLTAFVYEDNKLDEAMDLVDKTSVYGLTGSVFAQDEEFIAKFADRMIDSVGNLYINTQSTGSVVGNQPFGGARLSGTNDKAGGPHYVLRFTSPIAIKTQRAPLSSWKQIHMR
ncbi:hypothetical protein AAHC03_01865 [Spirometra sp. Aus1]